MLAMALVVLVPVPLSALLRPAKVGNQEHQGA
jgi:hypothetical protein